MGHVTRLAALANLIFQKHWLISDGHFVGEVIGLSLLPVSWTR